MTITCQPGNPPVCVSSGTPDAQQKTHGDCFTCQPAPRSISPLILDGLGLTVALAVVAILLAGWRWYSRRSAQVRARRARVEEGLPT
jgi:hypothetical protein